MIQTINSVLASHKNTPVWRAQLSNGGKQVRKNQQFSRVSHGESSWRIGFWEEICQPLI